MSKTVAQPEVNMGDHLPRELWAGPLSFGGDEEQEAIVLHSSTDGQKINGRESRSHGLRRLEASTADQICKRFPYSCRQSPAKFQSWWSD
jgi:hypothetical protein